MQESQARGGNLDRFHVQEQFQLIDLQLQPSPKRQSEIKTPSDWNVLQQSPLEPVVAPQQPGQQVQFSDEGNNSKGQQVQTDNGMQREMGFSFGAPAQAQQVIAAQQAARDAVVAQQQQANAQLQQQQQQQQQPRWESPGNLPPMPNAQNAQSEPNAFNNANTMGQTSASFVPQPVTHQTVPASNMQARASFPVFPNNPPPPAAASSTETVQQQQPQQAPVPPLNLQQATAQQPQP